MDPIKMAEKIKQRKHKKEKDQGEESNTKQLGFEELLDEAIKEAKAQKRQTEAGALTAAQLTEIKRKEAKELDQEMEIALKQIIHGALSPDLISSSSTAANSSSTKATETNGIYLVEQSSEEGEGFHIEGNVVVPEPHVVDDTLWFSQSLESLEVHKRHFYPFKFLTL